MAREAVMLVLIALFGLAEVAAEVACSAASSEASQALGRDQVLLQMASLSRHRQEEDESEGVGEECSTSIEGQECHSAVVWAQNHGILKHPELYNGLTHHSTFEEFQSLLNQRGLGSCERPCNLCHTAVPGETCHEGVRWAMLHGIREHPDWYSGLTTGSSFQEFQSHLHQGDHSECPEPCGLCRTVVDEDELCYKEVDWAIQHGIKLHPEWYPGLMQSSSRQEFQAYLSTKYDCPLACGVCHTAEEEEPCHEAVTWAKEHGIAAHPEWYPELTKDSSFEEFQDHLHDGGFKNCPRPCPKA